MPYQKEIKNLAIKMRKNGDSIIAISKKLAIAKSTISLWLRDIELPMEITSRLKENSKFGAKKGLEMIKVRRQIANEEIAESANKTLSKIKFKDKDLAKLLAAIIFWCEGSKRNLGNLRLTNSDPFLIKTFLFCLRNSFNIDEKKLRALMHLHDYHNEEIQIKFWSKTTGIPISQFHKSYTKRNTKIRIRSGYQGCITVSYGEAKVAKTLDAIYHSLAKKISTKLM